VDIYLRFTFGEVVVGVASARNLPASSVAEFLAFVHPTFLKN
jgi:hypothetical protein